MARVTKKDEQILAEVRKNYAAWREYFSQNLETANKVMGFVLGEQWTPEEKLEFKRYRKPGLIFNRLYGFIKQLVGEQRQNTSDLKVRATSDKVSQKEVDLREGLLRHISKASRSEVIYQNAFTYALLAGWGAFRVVTKYENENSFNQVIRLELVRDYQSVFFDVNATGTKIEGDYSGSVTAWSHKKFKNKWPKADIPSPTDYSALDDDYSRWVTKDTVLVGEYYRKEYYKEAIYELDNHQVVTHREYQEMMQKYEQMVELSGVTPVAEESEQSPVPSTLSLSEPPAPPQPPPPPQIIKRRMTQKYKIMSYVVSATEVLEKTEWPSKYLPILFVDGDSIMQEGRQKTIPFTLFATDAQRFLNFCGSDIAQLLKASRGEQFLATPKQIEGHTHMWNDPENAKGALIYNPDTKVQGGAPIKIPASSISPDYAINYQRASQDVEQILFRSPAVQGQQSNEISGVAVQNRTIQSNTASFTAYDNLKHAQEDLGRIVLDMQPRVYDSQRSVPIINAQGDQKSVVINQPLGIGDQNLNQIRGDGFEVTIEVGASFVAQKNIALQALLKLSSINPDVFPMIADLIAANLDIENMPQLVERLRTLVPENIIAQEKGLPPKPPQPNPAQQAAQQQAQLAQQNFQIRQQELALDVEKLKLEAEKLDADQRKTQTQMVVQQQKNATEITKAKLDDHAKTIQATANVHKGLQQLLKP